jgi:hypothetical protein
MMAGAPGTNTLDYLLSRSCASIRYRIRREILAQAPSSQDMLALQTQILQDRLVQEVQGGKFVKALKQGSFQNWGAYSGLMLEPDWRLTERCICDLTFRSALILHYAQ